jgi:hypothetical protein
MKYRAGPKPKTFSISLSYPKKIMSQGDVWKKPFFHLLGIKSRIDLQSGFLIREGLRLPGWPGECLLLS